MEGDGPRVASLDRRRVKDLEAELRRRRERGENVEMQEEMYGTAARRLSAKYRLEVFSRLRTDFQTIVKRNGARLATKPTLQKAAAMRAKARVAQAATAKASEALGPEIEASFYEEELDSLIGDELAKQVESIRKQLVDSSPQYAEIARPDMYPQTFEDFTSLTMTREKYSIFMTYNMMHDMVDQEIWTERHANEVFKHLVGKKSATLEKVRDLVQKTKAAATKEEQTDLLVQFLKETRESDDSADPEAAAVTAAAGGGKPKAAAEPAHGRRKPKPKRKRK